MALANLSAIVADVWEQTLRTSEDPFRSDIALEVFGRARRTYRERLDRRIINLYGEEVPRIEIVRKHIRQLGKPPKPPRIPE